MCCQGRCNHVGEWDKVLRLYKQTQMETEEIDVTLVISLSYFFSYFQIFDFA